MAFIAGVQATLISFTLGSNLTTLNRTTNVVAFVGLILDVTGTLAGVIHTFQLQEFIRDQQNIISLFTELESDSKVIGEWVDKTPDTADMNEIPSSLKETIQRASDTIKEIATEGMAVGPENNLFTVLEMISPPSLCTRFATFLPLAFFIFLFADEVMGVFQFGRIPLTAMGMGTLCLVLSIILLAAQSLQREVWIACTLAVLAVFSLSAVNDKKRQAPLARGVSTSLPLTS